MSNSGSPARDSYHHGDLKQALLRETARILREEGEESLSLRRLAAELGVSRTAPYNHFENKERLLQAVAEEGFERFRAAMAEARQRSRDLDGRAATLESVKAYVGFARDHKEYYDLMYGSMSWRGDGRDGSLAKEARATLRGDIERLERWQSRGGIDPGADVVRYAQLYWGTLHGISRLLLDGVYTGDDSVSRLCESAADMLWQQVAPR